VNQKALPLTEGLKMQVGVREGVYAHRVARKLRQKRADEAKHRQTSKALGLVDAKHAPLFSQFQFLRMKQGHSELSAMLPMFGAAAKAIVRVLVIEHSMPG
jgi:hypothetical protein